MSVVPKHTAAKNACDISKECVEGAGKIRELVNDGRASRNASGVLISK
jgi:hypothetical protein